MSLFPISFSLFLVPLFCPLLFGAQNEGSGEGEKDFQEMLGGILSGMQQMVGQFEKTAGNGKGGNLDGLKGLMNNFDADKMGQLLQNFGSPDMLADMLPEDWKELIPEEWREKLGEVIATEMDKLPGVWAAFTGMESVDGFFEQVKRKAPVLSELLVEVWAVIMKRWATFEKTLQTDQEALSYVQMLKATGGKWILTKGVHPFQGLSAKAKETLRRALQKAFPVLDVLLGKVVQNEVLTKWLAGLAGIKLPEGEAEPEKHAKEGKMKKEKAQQDMKEEEEEGDEDEEEEEYGDMEGEEEEDELEEMLRKEEL